MAGSARRRGARLVVEDRGFVRVLTLSNPRRRNAVDGCLLARLASELARAGKDGVRAIVLRGEGSQAFCAGYDLTDLTEAGARGPLPDAPLVRAVLALERCGPPVVAYLNGPALGAGCELACACDLRVASQGVVLGMPPARLGVVYAPAGIERLVALAGPSRARLMLFTGRPVDAPTALSWGLVDVVQPAARAEAAAFELAGQIADNAPLAVAGMRRILGALARPRLPLSERADLERLRRAAFLSEDAREGRRAFLEKRPPRFTGR